MAYLPHRPAAPFTEPSPPLKTAEFLRRGQAAIQHIRTTRERRGLGDLSDLQLSAYRAFQQSLDTFLEVYERSSSLDYMLACASALENLRHVSVVLSGCGRWKGELIVPAWAAQNLAIAPLKGETTVHTRTVRNPDGTTHLAHTKRVLWRRSNPVPAPTHNANRQPQMGTFQVFRVQPQPPSSQPVNPTRQRRRRSFSEGEDPRGNATSQRPRLRSLEKRERSEVMLHGGDGGEGSHEAFLTSRQAGRYGFE